MGAEGRFGWDLRMVWAQVLFGRSRGGLLGGVKDLGAEGGVRRGAYPTRSYAAWGWEVSVLEEPDVGIPLRSGERRGSGDPAPLRADCGSEMDWSD
jgi:hypothetical protein